MLMGILSLVFRSKLFVIGLAFLLIAFILSAIAVFHTQVHHYSSSGSLRPGQYSLGNESFENSYSISNRTLVLESCNATVGVLSGTNYTTYNVSGRLVLHPSDRPTVNVLKGNVSYVYNVTGVGYPASNLAVPALIFAIVGTIFAWVGLIRVFRGGG
ncbi:hypothetical protein [Thermococcus sp.]|uniref:hypothetical protein n=1 Tax=Thermococcus sp. TaxID=35749 RepID=UPI00261EAF54|nr:hypothetical protein [Thermococcus sp.]